MLKKYSKILLSIVALAAFLAVAPASAELLCDFENGTADYPGLFRDTTSSTYIYLSDNGAANDYLIMDEKTAGTMIATAYDETPTSAPDSVFYVPVGQTATTTVDFELIDNSTKLGGIACLAVLDPVNNKGIRLDTIHRNSGTSDGRVLTTDSQVIPYGTELANSGGTGSFPIAAVNDLIGRMSISLTNISSSSTGLDVSVVQLDALGGTVGATLWTYSTTLDSGMDLAANGFEIILGRSPHTGLNELHFDNLDVVAPIPEPSTLALLACGLVGLLAYAWRKRK